MAFPRASFPANDARSSHQSAPLRRQSASRTSYSYCFRASSSRALPSQKLVHWMASRRACLNSWQPIFLLALVSRKPLNFLRQQYQAHPAILGQSRSRLVPAQHPHWNRRMEPRSPQHYPPQRRRPHPLPFDGVNPAPFPKAFYHLKAELLPDISTSGRASRFDEFHRIGTSHGFLQP